MAAPRPSGSGPPGSGYGGVGKAVAVLVAGAGRLRAVAAEAEHAADADDAELAAAGDDPVAGGGHDLLGEGGPLGEFGGGGGVVLELAKPGQQAGEVPRQPLAGLLGVVAAGEGRPGVADDLHDDEGGREQHDAGMGLDRVVDLVADLVGDGARDGEAGDEVQPELRLPLAAGSGRVDVVAAEQSVAGEVGVGGPRRLHGPVADEDELLDPDDPVAAV